MAEKVDDERGVFKRRRNQMRGSAQVFVGLCTCVLSIFGEGLLGVAPHNILQRSSCVVRSRDLKPRREQVEPGKVDYGLQEYPAARAIQESIVQMRAMVKKMVRDGVAIEEVTDYATQGVIGVLSESIKLAKNDLSSRGKTCSTPYAIVVLGSLASGDASPYSDLDFCILVKEDTQAVRLYFEELLTVTNTVLLSFGETNSGIRGIQMCEGGHVPPYKDSRGTRGCADLLATPQALAKTSVFIAKVEKTPVLYRSLEELSFADGDPQLVVQYFKARAVASDQPSHKSLGRKLYQEKGLEFMDEAVREKDSLFLQETTNPRTGLGMFNPKNFFIMPIKTAVLGLSRYYGISEVRVLRCLEILSQRGLMNTQFALRLAETFRFASKVRLQAHLVRGSRYDWAFIGAPVQGYYRLTPQEEEMYPIHRRLILTLRESVKRFLESPGCSSFVNVLIP